MTSRAHAAVVAVAVSGVCIGAGACSFGHVYTLVAEGAGDAALDGAALEAAALGDGTLGDGAPARWCAGRTASFCDDFDREGAPVDGWTNQGLLRATLTLESSTFTSQPRSLRVTTEAVGGTSTIGGWLRHEFTASTHAQLRFAFLPTTVVTPTVIAEMAFGTSRWNVALVLFDADLRVQADGDPGDGGYSFTVAADVRAPPVGKWTVVVWDLWLDGTPRTSVSYDGTRLLTDTPVPVPAGRSFTHFDLGALVQQPQSPGDFGFDDVALEAE